MTDGPLRSRVAAAVFLCFLHVGGAFAQTDANVSLDEARAIARQALASGNVQLARRIGRGLLKADPRDVDAYLILSAANALAGNATLGRKAAAYAYRYSDRPDVRLYAAQEAARLSLAEQRPTLTQIWLRRAALNASNEADQKRIAQDYQQIRRANPWAFNIDLSARPSNNINNGSDSVYQIIDGVPLIGVNDGASQALSGLGMHADAALQYRLRGDARSRTSLGTRVVVQQVHLSDSAKRTAPNVKNSDFASTYADVSLSHAFQIGETRGNLAQISGAIGGLWYGGDLSYRLARIDGSRRWQINAATTLTLSGSIVQRDDADASILDTTTYGLRAGVTRKLANGDDLTFTLGIQDAESDFTNRQSTTLSVQALYRVAEQVGPVKVSAGLVLSGSDFPSYRVGTIVVPGGREDRSAYATVNLFFPDYDYAGFAPSLSIRAGKRTSNVSRFDSTQLSIGLGIQSKF